MAFEAEHIKIVVNEKDVIYYVRNETWTWNNIQSATVKELNLELYNKIIYELKQNVEAYQEKIKREEETKRLAELQISITKQDTFKALVNKLFDSNYELQYRVLNDDRHISHRDIHSVTIKKDGKYGVIYYDGTVCRNGSFNSSSTDRVWCVDFKFKTTRYVKIETAAKAIVKKITEAIVEEQLLKTKLMSKEQKDAEYTKLFNGYGIIYKREYSYHGHGTRAYTRETPSIKMLLEKNIEINGSIQHENNEIKIYGIKISGVLLTIEQVIKIKNLIKEFGA
jgi:hypothetical protein